LASLPCLRLPCRDFYQPARGGIARIAHFEVGMKFDDYEREFYSRYYEFAETVKVILEKAIEASNLPRPQSVQYRAKSPESLKVRLEEIGKLDSENIENERRDIAGVRIIFYTNTDVRRARDLR
jgi:ppGpp synthetase/RelA/SpoT-type nucleotidyltranferase